MPHQIIEYSANLESEVDIEALVRVLHETAAGIDALPIGGLRTRAVARQHYQIADGHPDNTFINVVLRLAPGRPFDVRKAAGEKSLMRYRNWMPTCGGRRTICATTSRSARRKNKWPVT
jgi:5-carboxymethyl-2-hydroxymuconate isomerase